MERFHLLDTDIACPEELNNPLDYEPHPLCIAAAREVKRRLGTLPQWADEVEAGKMFGVLVCRDAAGRVGFLAAYSGQIGGRADWPWFVPAVYDYLQPQGHFKQEEQAISAINKAVERQENDAAYRSLKAEVQRQRAAASAAIESYRQTMAEAKVRRDALRQGGEADEAALTRESQYQKAELRRLKAQWHTHTEAAEAALQAADTAIASLKHERATRSDALQRWLFDRFTMLNARGQQRSLTNIFAATAQRVPPSGAGECCAPKLLQYAFAHGLQPVQIAEFWQGRSPRMEIRHRDQFYPACRGKCKPILEWMLAASDVQLQGADAAYTKEESLPTAERLAIVHTEPDCFLVVDKPAGLLSVPGLTAAPSVESLLRNSYADVFMVHRLDMDTSGLMVVALSQQAYHSLQRQFLARDIYKRYIALLDGVLPAAARGTISLPLRPDLLDRPRQLVDHVHGKEAVTDYEVLAVGNGLTRVALTPHTGRTHQLRMHCAHAEGLGLPIVGDVLYGRAAQRLCLHAAELHFCHPLTGQRLRFSSAVPF